MASGEGDNKSANLLAAETAQLEEHLEGWGEVMLAADRILRWEKPWFPAVMMLAVSVVFLTTEQQQRFHEICSNLVKTQRRIAGWWRRLFALKEEKPKMYFMTVVTVLSVVAWIGQQVHNLFLTYLIVSFILLLPGLNRHRLITKYVGMAKREINKLLKQKEKKNE
ncbi:ADP-ribosylation factor-like protein 6-interacting protein 1 isoform X2 [Mobula birostris]|uniref:ADP-ribosylation factor-like protein 6-interacting protein 1 isoform X2 n=1 Tax=Mobula birostris TaxID=1983395 RepID=UPI003B27C41E